MSLLRWLAATQLRSPRSQHRTFILTMSNQQDSHPRSICECTELRPKNMRLVDEWGGLNQDYSVKFAATMGHAEIFLPLIALIEDQRWSLV